MKKINILLVDDEEGFRETITEHLAMRGYSVSPASCAEDAIQIIKKKNFEVAVVDIMMPGMDGMTLLKTLKESQGLIEIIMITGQGSIESAVEAIKKGAYNYLTKPVKFAELEAQIQKAYEKNLLSRQNILQKEELRFRRRAGYGEIIAESNKMKAVIDLAGQVAPSNSTVLLEGETGTGKEVVAHLIHNKSARADKPFVVVNCGALPENLLERELFGNVKGAFTGATESKPGLIGVTDEGTLFLDEIGEMSMAGQIALLRVIETGLYRRLGDVREEGVDIRVIVATNIDLNAAVREKRFREDLYHRLNVVRITMPPLRDRREDIVPLALYFLKTLPLCGMVAQGKVYPSWDKNFTPRGELTKTLGEDAIKLLISYNWPGNVRELSNVIERAYLISRGDKITPEQLGISLNPKKDRPSPFHIREGSNAHPSTDEDILSLGEAEKRHVLYILNSVNGDKGKAAPILGITLRHLYRKLEKYGRIP